MTTTTPAVLADLWTADRARQNAAVTELMSVTAKPVTWAGVVWDDTVAQLGTPTTTTGRSPPNSCATSPPTTRTGESSATSAR
ncbi:hypothetical protein ACWKSP_08125 [Micromonosporaceae bacterium Da 78-11]